MKIFFPVFRALRSRLLALLTVFEGQQGLGSPGVLLQLLQEVGTDLQVRAARVDELQRLQQRPLVLFHEVKDGHDGAPILSSNRVNEHARVLLLDGLINESDNFPGHAILIVKDQLTIVVQPVKRQELQARLRRSLLNKR